MPLAFDEKTIAKIREIPSPYKEYHGPWPVKDTIYRFIELGPGLSVDDQAPLQGGISTSKKSMSI